MRVLASAIVVGICLSPFSSAQTNTSACVKYPSLAWCDPSKSFEDRASAVIELMTLEEKINYTATYTPKGVGQAIPRLHWPEFSYHSEGLHGLRNSFDTLGLNATLLPQATGMAATGNIDLIDAMGSMMALEGRALNNVAQQKGVWFPRGAALFIWSPTMNLGRQQWGRFGESISEDPYLLGLYSARMVKALQGNGSHYIALAATCKHFAAYSLEGIKIDGHDYTRHNFDAIVSEQDLQGSYLPMMRACITQAKPAQVMCSYPALNGVPNCAHGDLLEGTIRGKWGYSGFVVSDQGAISNIGTPEPQGHGYTNGLVNGSAVAINAGCDQNDGDIYAHNLGDAVTQGLVTQDRINLALKRTLTQRFATGINDPPALVPWIKIPPSVLEQPSHQALALRAARESPALLVNKNGQLPWSLSASSTQGALRNRGAAQQIRRIAVIGPLANSSQTMMGAKDDYHPSFTVTYLQGLMAVSKALLDGEGGGKEDRCGQIFGSGSVPYGGEVDGMPEEVRALMGAVHRTVNHCTAVPGLSTLPVLTPADASAAVSSLTVRQLEGTEGPEGRIHSYIVRGMDGYDSLQLDYAIGCTNTKCQNDKGFAAAYQAATGADASLLFLGIDILIEKEGQDRPGVDLPGMQQDLAKAVAGSSKGPLVAVLGNGGPVSAPWLNEHADAVIDAFDGGQSGGQALAEILFGEVNPSGMMPYTAVPPAFVSAAPLNNMSMRAGPGRGYRFYYPDSIGPVVFAFGQGLSYTTFETKWSVSPPANASTLHMAALEATVTVTNTGKVAGGKVVQAYMKLDAPEDGISAGAYAPNPVLYGYQKVFLNPGESKQLHFSTATALSASSRALEPTDAAMEAMDASARDAGLVSYEDLYLLAEASLGWCAACDVDSEGQRWLRPGRYVLSIGAGSADEARRIARGELDAAEVHAAHAVVRATGPRVLVPAV